MRRRLYTAALGFAWYFTAMFSMGLGALCLVAGEGWLVGGSFNRWDAVALGCVLLAWRCLLNWHGAMQAALFRGAAILLVVVALSGCWDTTAPDPCQWQYTAYTVQADSTGRYPVVPTDSAFVCQDPFRYAR